MEYHTFKIRIPEELQKYVEVYVNMEVSCEASLPEVLAAFESFLKAVTYQISDSETLAVVEKCDD